MPKIGFNPQALSLPPGHHHGANVVKSICNCAFVPVMPRSSGVQAIIEGLRLANIEGPVLALSDPLAKDVDAGDIEEGG